MGVFTGRKRAGETPNRRAITHGKTTRRKTGCEKHPIFPQAVQPCPPRATPMNNLNLLPKRGVFARLSILAGNTLQIAGIAAACLALATARSAQSKAAA